MKRVKIVLSFFIVLLFLPHASLHSNNPVINGKYAVVVANDQKYCHESSVPASNCAKLLVSILKDRGFSQGNVKLLTNAQATLENVTDALNWMRSVETPDSECVIAFFGHGSFNAVLIYKYYIWHEQIRDLLPVVSQKQLVIIDTCMAEGAILPGIDGITLCGPGRIVVTPKTGENGSEVAEGKYTSLVYWFFYQGIREGRADLDGDGQISIQEAGQYASWNAMCDQYEAPFFL